MLKETGKLHFILLAVLILLSERPTCARGSSCHTFSCSRGFHTCYHSYHSSHCHSFPLFYRQTNYENSYYPLRTYNNSLFSNGTNYQTVYQYLFHSSHHHRRRFARLYPYYAHATRRGFANWLLYLWTDSIVISIYNGMSASLFWPCSYLNNLYPYAYPVNGSIAAPSSVTIYNLCNSPNKATGETPSQCPSDASTNMNASQMVRKPTEEEPF